MFFSPKFAVCFRTFDTNLGSIEKSVSNIFGWLEWSLVSFANICRIFNRDSGIIIVLFSVKNPVRCSFQTFVIFSIETVPWRYLTILLFLTIHSIRCAILYRPFILFRLSFLAVGGICILLRFLRNVPIHMNLDGSYSRGSFKRVKSKFIFVRFDRHSSLSNSVFPSSISAFLHCLHGCLFIKAMLRVMLAISRERTRHSTVLASLFCEQPFHIRHYKDYDAHSNTICLFFFSFVFLKKKLTRSALRATW